MTHDYDEISRINGNGSGDQQVANEFRDECIKEMKLRAKVLSDQYHLVTVMDAQSFAKVEDAYIGIKHIKHIVNKAQLFHGKGKLHSTFDSLNSDINAIAAAAKKNFDDLRKIRR